MRLFDSEMIEQSDRIGGHVAQRIGRIDLLALHLLLDEVGEIDLHGDIDARGAADVAIVEAHDVKAARGDLLAEAVVPQDHLRAEAHDEQHCRLGPVAERAVAKLHAVGGRELFRRMGDRRVHAISSGFVGRSLRCNRARWQAVVSQRNRAIKSIAAAGLRSLNPEMKNANTSRGADLPGAGATCFNSATASPFASACRRLLHRSSSFGG